MKKLFGILALVVAVAGPALAHDIWLEPTTTLLRPGDWLRLSLMLGNHGNEHRDFRLASKVSAGDQDLVVYGPDNQKVDLSKSLIDNGLTPQEGFWSARFQPEKPGLYLAASMMDKVMSYAPVRDVKSAKTFFLVSPSLDKVSQDSPGFDRVLGHPLEIVPLVNPATLCGPEAVIRVRVLYKGKPLPNNKVSFIPKGTPLHGSPDPAYERATDANGEVEMKLREANLYLIATRKDDADAKGKGYQSVGYSATLCVSVSGLSLKT